MNIENLKKVRESIADEKIDTASQIFSIMFTTECKGSPRCISGHAWNLALPENPLSTRCHSLEEIYKVAQEYLELSDKQVKDLFVPKFEFAHIEADNLDVNAKGCINEYKKGFITKDRVLNCLDLIISGETNIKKAWKGESLKDLRGVK